MGAKVDYSPEAGRDSWGGGVEFNEGAQVGHRLREQLVILE